MGDAPEISKNALKKQKKAEEAAAKKAEKAALKAVAAADAGPAKAKLEGCVPGSHVAHECAPVPCVVPNLPHLHPPPKYTI